MTPAVPPVLWSPEVEHARATQMAQFARRHAGVDDLSGDGYQRLHAWSVERPQAFWRAIWQDFGVVGEGPLERVLVDGEHMPGARWFPDVRLNFAENLLQREDGLAVIAWDERRSSSTLGYAELRAQAAALAAGLREAGIGPGDRVAGYLHNGPQALAGMLAAASVGAVWSCCSPDFGTAAVIDRFEQIEPRALIAVDGYHYNGKPRERHGPAAEIAAALPTLALRWWVPNLGHAAPAGFELLGAVLQRHAGAEPRYERLPFDHPLYILYSSGTTGKPKCIVHGAGGTLLQHLKEHRLHADLRPDDRLFYFTTTGWMMWNWLASGLASGATLVLFDGAPFSEPEILWDLAQAERVNLFGTSAKYLAAQEQAGVRPAATHDLSSIRTLLSTGSPLPPEGFDYVYREIGRELCLSSICGGTDIVSCFLAGNPAGPVHRGELQALGLGMAVEVFDDAGRPLRDAPGELVCTRPFPSMPVGFWNDPDGSRYRAAYFERFPGVWHHGDYVTLTPRGTAIVHGRSDAVLNPGGVRIGTAELYRVVELCAGVAECVAVGQEWQADVRVVLFVRMTPGATLDAALADSLRREIRDQLSPRHVPAVILPVDDIPRTLNGKIAELAVREVIHGRPVKNTEALANPESLALYRDLDALRA